MDRCRPFTMLTLFLFFMTRAVDAQVRDDFSDGDFIQGTSWSGDTVQFVVDNNELRLFSSGSDSSSLVTVFQSSPDTLEWRFRLRMTFAPSSQNYVRYYLWSDAVNLEGPLNGYYLQFGETGAADAIELRYQSGWTSTVLLRGSDSLISNGADIRLKVVRYPGGFWQVAYDPSGGEQFVLSGTAFHSAVPSNSILGWKCVYTSSNAQKCYLDDIYAGPFQLDLNAPELSGIHFIGDSGLGLTWDEPLEFSTAADPSSYWMTPWGMPDSIASLSTDGRSYALHFSSPFEDTTIYVLQIHGIRDESGNVLQDTVSLPVFKVFPAEAGQVVVSEIMADPAGSPGLPPGEYVELYNRSNKVVSLGGCYLHDASSGCPVPDDTIKPGDFIVYTTLTDAPAFHAAGILRVRGVGCFPTLNNDGDSLRLIGPSGALIDAVDYDKGMYADPLRDDQGWSLERMDVSTKCSSRENWKASVDPSGGTPGRLNSAQGIYRDLVAPLLVHAYPADDSTTLLYFTEWPDTASSNDPAMYILDPGGVNPIAVRAGKGKPHMEVKWPQPLLSGVNYTLVVDSGIRDCSGNNLEGMFRVPLGLPEPIASGDLIINEVLFNPIGEDGDFVEVYNQSTHSIDLGEIRFAEADPADGIIKNAVGLQSERRILLPGEYAVAAPYPDRISGRYPMNGKVNLLTASLSGYDDDEGIVVLLDASFRVIDQFRYSDDFHFPLLADPEGVSLERLRFDGHTNDGQNWHSASSQCGYATPGLKNSQQVDSIAEQDAWFFLEPRLFSPDNDGHHDVLLLNASLPKPGYMAAVNIYSEQGMLVSRIAANEYLGPEARWTWNGTGDDGYMLPPGLYIVSARFLHIDGDVRTIRKACVIAPGRISN